MKFYLSSYGLGNEADKLVSMVPENKRTAVIFNALDFSSDFERKRASINREVTVLAQLGLEPEEFDLRLYFRSHDQLKEQISNFGLVWVIGGNTFVLRRAMDQSGLDRYLLENRSDEDFVYAGYSAGVCVLAPTLRGIDLVDDPYAVPKGYNNDAIWEGLSLIDYCIVPHYKSDHPESELVDKAVEYFLSNKISFRVLHDGEVLIID